MVEIRQTQRHHWRRLTGTSDASTKVCLGTHHLASSLQALEEQLDCWNQLKDSPNVYLESYQLLTKCRAELDDIQFGMMVGRRIPKSDYAW